MIEVDLVEHVEVKEMPEPQIGRLIRLEQIQTEGLKEQTGVNHIARADVVSVTLNQIGRNRVELDAAGDRLFVSPNLELYFVAFEFALDHLRHFNALAFQLHISVVCNRMIINRKQDV